MKKINLVYPEKGDIKFKRISYPDGQNAIIIENIGEVRGYLSDSSFKGIEVRTRVNNWVDLEVLVCTVKSLNELGHRNIHLYCPMFLGQRSDRKFEDGSCNYLKDVICPIINSLNFESVTVLDPHSFVLEGCLNNFKSQSNLDLVKFALNSIYNEKT